MIYISVTRVKLLVFVLFTLSACLTLAADWPVKRNIDLSSGFGDFRMNRFHTGVDIRTGGKIGESIYSPVDGSVYRIRTAYTGYGKGLYILGDDGYIYVYGHLNDFNGKIDNLLKAAQISSKRYYQDITLPKDSIPVKKGEFLGYTGQTGAGAPHLHFEKRTLQNVPVNPLTNGFTIDDKVKPVFTQLGFKMMDDNSLFANGYRELTFNVTGNGTTGKYVLDSILYFNRPFAVFTGVFDQMKNGGMKQTVYKLSLKIDGKLFYQIQFDSLDFSSQLSANFEYEYLKAVNREKNIRRLYAGSGNEYWGSGPVDNKAGIIAFSERSAIGYHTAEITAEDSFGNSSVLKFNFIWGPEEYLYTFDSLVSVKPKDNFFYFTPIPEIASIKIDSVIPYINKAERWGVAKGTEVEILDNGQLRCKLVSNSISKATASLFVFCKNAVIEDNLFNGVQPRGKVRGDVIYELLDDGLLVRLAVRARYSSKAHTEFYYQDSLLGIEPAKMLNMNTYHSFVKPQAKYSRVDRIAFVLSDDTLFLPSYSDSAKLVVVGLEDNQEVQNGFYTFVFNKHNFYKPRFIEIRKRLLPPNYGERLVSTVCKMYPEAFICREPFDIRFSLPNLESFYDKIGICWSDEESEKWSWLQTTVDKTAGYVSAKSNGGGLFAALYDLVPPEVSKVSIIDGRSYRDTKPSIHFLIDDNLSGIEDDRSILVRLNNEWLIPEYDPESKRLKTKPLEPLPVGKHHLGIEVKDRVGNVYEQYLNFYVK